MKEDRADGRGKLAGRTAGSPPIRQNRQSRRKNNDEPWPARPMQENAADPESAGRRRIARRAIASNRIESGRPRLDRGTFATLFHGGGDPMATAQLRVFPRPEEETGHETESPGIPIRLADLYPLLAHAFRDNYSWLQDFEQDKVLVTSDLYEVVRAFSNYRPSA
jgi:hypothetical protein